MASMMNISQLHTNKLNESIYDELKADSPQYQELLKSVSENGLLTPLVVRPDGLILSGHRRFSVIKALGWEEVPVEIKNDGDDRILLIEYNRYRAKTGSELMREAELLHTVYAERAELNLLGRGNAVAEEDKVDARKEVAATIGMGERTYGKLKKVYELAKVNPNAAAKMAAVDAGTISIDSAYKSVRTLIKESESEGEEKPEIPDMIKFYNSWQFSENDPRFGMPHPGRIPGQIPANIIYYYTEPGDLVVDPMAGGGSTLDAAEYLERRCIGYDVAPRRPDIIAHDISLGFPDEAKDAQLIFMDPPYWNMIDEGYSDGSASRKSLDGFVEWYDALMAAAGSTVRRGGFVAVINMGQYFRLPAEFTDGYIDWPIRTYQALQRAGLTPWARVGVTYPTTLHGGFDVEAAKAGRFMLPILGDIIIMRRTK